MTTATSVSVFTPNAQRLICKRYAHRGPNHPPCSNTVHLGVDRDSVETIHHETPEELLWRISMGNQTYYDALFNPIRFLPNSPTIFNMPCSICGQTEPAGTMSACFKFDVQDSMVSIMDVGTKAAMVLKMGGGVGYYTGFIRPKDEPIRSTHGKACGPIEVMKTYQRVAEMITQAGKRDAAQMAIMDIDHPDIREFIHLKDEDPQTWNYFNISVAIDDKFMMNLQLEENAKKWKEIVESAWRSGDPGMYFKDAAERGNPTPWLGRLTGTNPCGEVPLLDNEPCNLGSINLAQFVHNEPVGVTYGGIEHKMKIIWEELEEVVRTATRYLDEVLDKNIFPTPEIDAAARLTRKLGLGVMGWADLLAQLRIPYDSDQAIGLAEEVMGFIQKASDEESEKLSFEKGRAPCFEGRSNEEGGRDFRNATRTCIAPTGSISWLADCSGGIEPHFSLEYTHTMGDGDETEWKAKYPEDFTPKVANEIAVEWHIKHQAAFQKYTDLAVSKTINLPNDATRADIHDAYILAWQLRCKGVTVFRDGCREGGEQVLKSTDTPIAKDVHQLLNVLQEPGEPITSIYGVSSTNGHAPVTLQPVRRKLESERHAVNHRFQVADHEGYLNIGLYPDGSPGELFIKMSKEGSTVSGLMDVIGILTSVALQYGVPLATLTHKLRHTRFEPAGMTDNPEQRHASSLIDYVFGWIERKFVLRSGPESPTGECCPECGAALIHSEGCIRCTACEYDRCG